jgi:hypothetical protein
MDRRPFAWGAAAALVASTALTIAALPRAVVADTNLDIVALPGYSVSVFAHGTASWSNPDAIVVANGRVFIDYQNHSAKDGSNLNPSTIVEYTSTGKAVASFAIPGHSDGLRLNPVTRDLWATVNEDAKPALYVIKLPSGRQTRYSLAAPHGGGCDDLVFVRGRAILVASNPTLNSAGDNVFPALEAVTLNANLTTTLTPVLAGDAMATDLVTKSRVTLNIVDPDSLSTDLAGHLVLIDQGGTQLVFLGNPNTPQQAVSRLAVGTQLDDTVWAPSAKGSLFVVDATRNTTYVLRATFKRGTIYTEAPNDSGVASFVGTIDPGTGNVTPIAIGFGKPTGMAWGS